MIEFYSTVKRNLTPDIRNDMDKSQKHAEWNKLDSKHYILQDSNYRTFWKRQKHRNKIQISSCNGLGVEGRNCPLSGMRELSGMMEILYLNCGSGYTLYVFVRIYRTIHLKRVNFTLYAIINKQNTHKNVTGCWNTKPKQDCKWPSHVEILRKYS